jgi:hypothetical protein
MMKITDLGRHIVDRSAIREFLPMLGGLVRPAFAIEPVLSPAPLCQIKKLPFVARSRTARLILTERHNSSRIRILPAREGYARSDDRSTRTLSKSTEDGHTFKQVHGSWWIALPGITPNRAGQTSVASQNG